MERSNTGLGGAGPVQGFGKMWQKTYLMAVGAAVAPRDAITAWKAFLLEQWPAASVVYADDESFTMIAPRGHKFAGWMTFCAERAARSTVVRAHLLVRAHDPLSELAVIFGENRRQDRFWVRSMAVLGESLGAIGTPVETRSICLDSRRQWRNARNIRYVHPGLPGLPGLAGAQSRPFRRKNQAGVAGGKQDQ